MGAWHIIAHSERRTILLYFNTSLCTLQNLIQHPNKNGHESPLKERIL